MNIFLNIKLIVRNWWRNKLFFPDFTIQSYSWIRMHQSAYDFFSSMNIMWKNIIPTVTSFIYYVKTLQWKKVLK